MIFNPANWYWIVAGDETQVYSSATGNYVPVANATYAAWLQDGGLPTRIANEVELGEVLAQHSLRPIAAAVLDGYKDAQAMELTVETVAKVCFYLLNEIRVLKGQAPINAAQFKQAIKDLM